MNVPQTLRQNGYEQETTSPRTSDFVLYMCVCSCVCVSLCVCACMSTCASVFVCMCGCVYVGFILMIVQDKKASIRYEHWLNGGSPSESLRYDKCLYDEIDGVLITATIKASAGSNVFNRPDAACAPCGQVPASSNADANPQGIRHLADDMFNTPYPQM